MTYPPFTRDGYRDTIKGILSQGYAIADFASVDPNLPELVLRHDVDQSIGRACALAELEASEGWRSSYFVLMRSEMYNPWSRDNTKLLRSMLGMGHEIGLHLDGTDYSSEDALQDGAAIECSNLEDVIGKKVDIISFHRPTPAQIRRNATIAGRLHTYMDRFTKAMGYCSDSRGAWGHGHPWDHAALKENRALQLLTHAVWWSAAEPSSPVERLSDIVAEKTAALDAELAANSDVWRNRNAAVR